MSTWLRTVLAVVTLSIPLAGCAAQAGSDSTEGTAQALSSAVANAETPRFAKGTLARVDAKFSQWLVTPTGKVAGMLLDDGSIAMVPRHAAKDVTKTTLQAGDAVHVEGFQRQGSPVYAFASVKKGDTVIVAAKRPDFAGATDRAPGKAWRGGEHARRDHASDHAIDHAIDPQRKAEWQARHEKERAAFEALGPASATGTVVAMVPGRHGEPRAVVLSDGTVAYAKHDAKLGELVKKGDVITVSGKGGSYDLGSALVIDSVKLPSGETKEI